MVTASVWMILGAAWADLPAGAPVPEAIDLQVGPEGLDVLSAVAPSLLPTDALAIDDTFGQTGAPQFCLGYSYGLENISADFEVVDLALIPEADALVLDAELLVSLNDAANNFTLTLDAICLIDEVCEGWIDPFTLNVTAPITLEAVGSPGARTLQATVGELDLSQTLSANELNTGCTLDDIEQVLNAFGLSLFDLLIGLFGETIGTSIEDALNEALVAVALSGETSLGEGTLTYAIEPAEVIHSTFGLEIVLAGLLDAPQAECVADDDPGSSRSTGAGLPNPADNPAGTQLAVHAHGDLIQQALYAAWRGGALCLEVGGDDDGLDLGGLALDTSLLGLIGGEELGALYPEPKPVVLEVRPHAPPEASFAGPTDVTAELRELELVFLAELDGRMARGLGVEVDADIAVDLLFDDVGGTLGVDVGVNPDDISARLAGDAMVAGIADRIESDFPGVMATLLDSLLPSLVGDALAFPLPTFEGLGLVGLEVGPSGGGDWLGLFAELGTPTYADPAATGCGCDGEASTCEGGCATAPVTGWTGLWVLLLAALRRRRQDP